MKLSEFKKTFKWVGGAEPTIHSHNIFKGDEALWEVEERPSNLEFVLPKDQTEEICLAAVEESKHALRYVHNQTVEICLAAVKKNSFAYQYVNKDIFEPEEEIC